MYINTSEKNYTGFSSVGGDNIFLNLACNLITSCYKKCNCLCQLFYRITTYLKGPTCEGALKALCLAFVFVESEEALEKS